MPTTINRATRPQTKPLPPKNASQSTSLPIFPTQRAEKSKIDFFSTLSVDLHKEINSYLLLSETVMLGSTNKSFQSIAKMYLKNLEKKGGSLSVYKNIFEFLKLMPALAPIAIIDSGRAAVPAGAIMTPPDSASNSPEEVSDAQKNLIILGLLSNPTKLSDFLTKSVEQRGLGYTNNQQRKIFLDELSSLSVLGMQKKLEQNWHTNPFRIPTSIKNIIMSLLCLGIPIYIILQIFVDLSPLIGNITPHTNWVINTTSIIVFPICFYFLYNNVESLKQKEKQYIYNMGHRITEENVEKWTEFCNDILNYKARPAARAT